MVRHKRWKIVAQSFAAKVNSKRQRAIACAIEQPADVEVDEIVVRPTTQDF